MSHTLYQVVEHSSYCDSDYSVTGVVAESDCLESLLNKLDCLFISGRFETDELFDHQYEMISYQDQSYFPYDYYKSGSILGIIQIICMTIVDMKYIDNHS